MSSEIEVPETPNWLQELEAKRERRVKARLGHETGAGAPCLKCGEKCPGLDLHFWRKCCKICKCAKEEHEVQDDDIYGWAQFQLLGSKPNKIKTKITLPGKKDELELDWIPKGHNDTVDKYLKTLPPEQLPVKGSQAAQDRKQLLQKQIPIHDIDPTLCHELSNEELEQMNDYISHVKQSSVGVGQIVSLSNVIKAHLHMLDPSEAALIASRYPKGIPLSEIVKLQSQNRANALKSHGLNEKLDKLNLQDVSNKTLPNFKANTVSATEENINPWTTSNARDIIYPGYTNNVNCEQLNPQFSTGLKPGLGQNMNYHTSNHPDQNVPLTLDEKFKQNSNFDPKNTPSQFLQPGQPYPYKFGQQDFPVDEDLAQTLGRAPDHLNSAFAPYNKASTAYKPGQQYIGESPSRNTSNLLGHGMKSPSGYRPGEAPNQNTSMYPGNTETGYVEDTNPLPPSFAKNLAKYPSGLRKSEQVENFGTPGGNNTVNYENVEEMRKNNRQGLPNYIPGKYNVLAENQSPTKIPKGVKDLAFTTYDSNDPNLTGQKGTERIQGEENALAPPNLAYENYPPGYFDNQTTPYDQNTNRSGNNQFGVPPTGRYPDYVAHDKKGPYDENLVEQTRGQYYNPSNTLKNIPGVGSEKNQDNGYVPHPGDNIQTGGDYKNSPHPLKGAEFGPGGHYGRNIPFGQPLHDQRAGQQVGLNESPSKRADVGLGSQYGQNMPYDETSDPRLGQRVGLSPLKGAELGPGGRYGQNVPYDRASGDPRSGQHIGTSNSLSKGADFGQGGQYGQNVPYNEAYADENVPYDQNPSHLRPGQIAGLNNSPLKIPNNSYGQNIPQGQYDQTNTTGNGPNSPYSAKPNKKLSELHPGKINIDEDYLHPSQVTIGAIQDINYPEIKAAMQGTNDFYEDYSPDSLREILNNVKLPDCHYCKKPFEENEFAITIDRANVLFHAQCFKCAGCNQILADNVYFYNKETDNVYCGRDYAKVRGFPRCKACDELIFTKEYCLAENSTFHLKHFCCIECDKPLAGQDYTLEDEMPYCLPCFEHSKASKCSSCGRIIKPDEVGCSLNGVHFHVDGGCFACKVCKKPLMNQKLLLRNEKLYCSYDCFGTESK